MKLTEIFENSKFPIYLDAHSKLRIIADIVMTDPLVRTASVECKIKCKPKDFESYVDCVYGKLNEYNPSFRKLVTVKGKEYVKELLKSILKRYWY